MWVFVLWALFSAGVGYLASERGRSWIAFFLFALLLSPVLALIVLLVMPNARLERMREEDRRRQHERDLESIKEIAKSAAASPEPKAVDMNASSLADELGKLAALKDKGVLTEAEFNRLKMDLLAPKA